MITSENFVTRDMVISEIENANFLGIKEDLEQFDKDCEDVFGKGWSVWGKELINDNCFEKYIMEELDECFAIPEEAKRYIDYDAWISDRKEEYTWVSFGGVHTFWGLQY